MRNDPYVGMFRIAARCGMASWGAGRVCARLAVYLHRAAKRIRSTQMQTFRRKRLSSTLPLKAEAA